MTARRWTLGIGPIAVLFLGLFVGPLLIFLTVSLRETAGLAQVGNGPTIDNFARLLGDPYYFDLIQNTLKLATYTTILSLIIAYPIAYLIARAKGMWSRALFLFVIASMFTSFIIGALGLKVLLADSGPLNKLLMALKLVSEPIHLANSITAVLLGMINSMMPLTVLSLVPACEAIPEELIEASYGLGASRWQTFWRVIFVLNRVSIASVGLLVFAISTGLFITPLLLGGGKVRVIGMEIRLQILGLLDYPMGATLGVLLLAIVSVLVGVSLFLSRKLAVRGGSL